MLRKLICLFSIFNIFFCLPAEEVEMNEDLIMKVIEDSELNTPLVDLSAMPSSIIGGP